MRRKEGYHGEERAATSHKREGEVDHKVGERREGVGAGLGLAQSVEMRTNGYTLIC